MLSRQWCLWLPRSRPLCADRRTVEHAKARNASGSSGRSSEKIIRKIEQLEHHTGIAYRALPSLHIAVLSWAFALAEHRRLSFDPAPTLASVATTDCRGRSIAEKAIEACVPISPSASYRGRPSAASRRSDLHFILRARQLGFRWGRYGQLSDSMVPKAFDAGV